MRYLLTVSLLMMVRLIYGQDAPGTTTAVGNAASESKSAALPVNLYTGMASVSIPIYNYSSSGSGLTWPVSLDYIGGGGIQLGEAASTVGLGWNFNASGAITRTVRGVPDDLPTGYLSTPAIPTDFRSNGTQYASFNLDAQQDVFQYNFKGRSGQFMIGKNKQVIQIPNTKMKITYQVLNAYSSSIISFRIVTEDGTTYDFATEEITSVFGNPDYNVGYSGNGYGSTWWLTDVIAPFGTDTIRFNYVPISINTTQDYPEYTYQVSASSNQAPPIVYQSVETTIDSWKLSSIVFPDKKNIQVLYSNKYSYSFGDGAVAKIKVCDSIFRFGFALDYSMRYNDGGNSDGPYNLFLTSVTPYTPYQEQKGYTFEYNPSFAPGSPDDSYQKDYWGFYNGASGNQNLIPRQGGNLNEADRTADGQYTVYNSLSKYTTPSGGYVSYDYELNDCYPLLKSGNTLSFDASASSNQRTVSFNQVLGSRQQMVINLDPSVSRGGSPPISGDGSITLTIMSSDNSVQYAATTFSLYDLFYLGSKIWQFNIPNGTYLLIFTTSDGTSFTNPLLINLSWESRTTDNSNIAYGAGGLRVWRITHGGGVDNAPVYEDIQYVMEDGKSSGFLGDLPSFTYPYTETDNYGSGNVIHNYTVVNSNPINTQDYTQGTPAGYSRVVVYNGTTYHNQGKTVFDYTGPADVNCNLSTRIYPYTPQDLRSWGMGLPKRTSVYDNSGRLVKRVVNTFQLDTITYNTIDFLSLKLGNSSTYVSGDPYVGLTRVPTYIGQQYYPSSGRAYIISTADTLYQTDGSVSTSYRNYVYDANYNVTKVVSSYDRTRGLQLETRYYYPYNYTIGGAIGTLRNNGILGPVISTENWITGDANPRIISGSITDYQQLPAGYIKPLTSYALQTGAPVAQSTIGLFNASTLNRNADYFVAQTNYPNYSSKGNLLQVTNAVNGKSSSTIRDYNDGYAVATINNAGVGDVAYTSFESDGSGGWTIGSTTRDRSGALTGKAAYNLSWGSISKSGLNANLSYIVSVWAKASAGVVINGVSQSASIASQNSWNLYFTTLSGITSVSVSGVGTIDELRLYPKDANMATTTYEPLVGATSSCDANNTVVYTTYDLLNRPKLIKDKDLNIIKRFDYSDADSLINTSPLWNRSAYFQVDPVNVCAFDSVVTVVDLNPWSDSYNQTTVTTNLLGANYCTCSISDQYPDYKIVNGKCRQALKVYTSAVFHEGSYICGWHWVWPDCSTSDLYTEVDDTKPDVLTGCPTQDQFPQ